MKVHRNRLCHGLLVALALVLLAGCGGKPAGSDAHRPLIIGASVSLTGDFADNGTAVRRGYQLWAETVNAHGGLLGRRIQLKVVDDTSRPTQVVTNYQN